MKRGPVIFTVGLLVVAVATACGWAVVRAERVRLEDELARLQATEATARNRAIDEGRVAARHAEAARLAHEISALRDELALRSAAVAPGPAGSGPAVRRGGAELSNPWPNAGRREPLATFQSVQWAIHEADLDALVGLLAFDDAALAEAVDFFDRLDPESREEFGSPQRLIAAAVATKSRTGIEQADLVSATTSPGEEGVVSARLRISGSQVNAREITLQFQPSPGGWRLRVPAEVVTGYRNLLLGPLVDPYTEQFVR